MDVFDWVEWEAWPRLAPTVGEGGAPVAGAGVAPAAMNRRLAAARGLSEYAVIPGARKNNSVPAPVRRSGGLRAPRGRLWAHIEPRGTSGVGGPAEPLGAKAPGAGRAP